MFLVLGHAETRSTKEEIGFWLCNCLLGLCEGLAPFQGKKKKPQSYLVTARQELREGEKGGKGTSSLKTLLWLLTAEG